MTKSTEFRARRRTAIPPLWGMCISAMLVLLYTFAVASATASVVQANMESEPPASIGKQYGEPAPKADPTVIGKQYGAPPPKLLS